MITLDLRRAIGRAAADAGLGGAPDPGLRPGGGPGQYASSVAFGLAAEDGRPAAGIAARLAARLEGQEPWIATAAATGAGYVTITITPDALQGVADRVIEAGPGCVRSDALAGRKYQEPGRAGAWEQAATWEEARELLAAELTARLAEAAGAGGEDDGGERREEAREAVIRSGEKETEPAKAVACAGRDAVRFALARVVPGQPADVDAAIIARHRLGNPAYAVRYAHARAASGVRWAATTTRSPQRPSAHPEDLALLDALSWLPERVATAARRGRPDEFARYLERVAGATLAALTGQWAGDARLVLARAAMTGLAAGLELLGISAPERL